MLARATGRMQAQKLIDLIDQTAPDEGVVDVHEIESKFADGSRRIPLVEEAAVCTVVEGAADTTRRMSAVDVDAAVAMAIDDASDTTRRMSAVQANELAALITPVEVVVAETCDAPDIAVASAIEGAIESEIESEIEIAPVVVTFRAPTVTPVEDDEPVVERRSARAWMIGAVLAVAGAGAALAAVLLA